MANKCGCYGVRANNESWVNYCPLHEAAPDLLAALKMALETEEKAGRLLHAWHQYARAAIAKAEGGEG